MYGCVWQPVLNEHDDDDDVSDYNITMTLETEVKEILLHGTNQKARKLVCCTCIQ